MVSYVAYGYSFQTHEQLVDLTWTDTIKPLLKRRFPNLSEADLSRAHSYAYGGSAIQDLGYYPFGNEFFSNLTHYVRSADFVQSLFRHARDANELAFAIGALSHYIGDTIGHSDSINPAVAVEFPKLGQKFGPSVNYAENPHAHVRTEFAFDINEASKRHLAPSAYLRHVGLRVPYELLANAFRETYGLELGPVLGKRRPVIRGYRFAVRSLLPRVAYAEVVLHRDGFPPEPTTEAARIFDAQLARTEFEVTWNQYRKKPGFKTYSLAAIIFVLPKIGPLSQLSIRGPQPSTVERYIESVNRSTSSMRELLRNFDKTLSLPNRDLDTGDRVKPGGYRLTDETYAKLLDEITRSATPDIPATLKQNLLDYYADPSAPITTKKDSKKWERVQTGLALLQSMNTRPDVRPN
jgi:hypothetical protein